MLLKGERGRQGAWAKARPPVPGCRGEPGSIDELYTTGLFFQNHLFCFGPIRAGHVETLHMNATAGTQQNSKSKKGWKEQGQRWNDGAFFFFFSALWFLPSHIISERPAASSGGYCGRVRGHDSTNYVGGAMWRWAVRMEEKKHSADLRQRNQIKCQILPWLEHLLNETDRSS